MSSELITSSTEKRWFKADSDSSITIVFDEAKPVRFSTAYWSIRGLGAPLRMMLCAAKVNHIVYLYDLLEDGDHGWKSTYYVEKATKFIPNYTPFMNLPCVADEDEKVVVTQLNACMVYVGNACGMMGQNPVEQATIVQYLCEAYDLRVTMTDYVYGKAGTVESVMKSGKGHFEKFENHFRNKDQKCFTFGNSITAADFHLFELIDQYDALQKATDSTDVLSDYPNVRAFYDEFSKLEYV
jgi:glutathione S-transferase